MTPTEKLKQEISELQIALSKETSKVKGADSKDENLRMEFAKAFNWTKMPSFIGSRKEYTDPTWPEIFVKIGELLNIQNRLHYSNRIDDFDDLAHNLIRRIDALENPKITSPL
jgi:hypothetical protein